MNSTIILTVYFVKNFVQCVKNRSECVFDGGTKAG